MAFAAVLAALTAPASAPPAPTAFALFAWLRPFLIRPRLARHVLLRAFLPRRHKLQLFFPRALAVRTFLPFRALRPVRTLVALVTPLTFGTLSPGFTAAGAAAFRLALAAVFVTAAPAGRVTVAPGLPLLRARFGTRASPVWRPPFAAAFARGGCVLAFGSETPHVTRPAGRGLLTGALPWWSDRLWKYFTRRAAEPSEDFSDDRIFTGCGHGG